MKRRNQSPLHNAVTTARKSFRLDGRAVRRALGGMFIVVSLSATVYLLMVVSQFVTGVSKAEAAPQVIRLQLVTAGNDAVTGHRLTTTVNQALRDSPYTIEIVERQTLPRREISKTLVVSRQPDLAPARYLARQLRLPADRVMYQPLEFNRNLVTVTLLAGDDLNVTTGSAD